jgi:hypothetical protein
MAERKYWDEEMETIAKKDLHRIETETIEQIRCIVKNS